MEVVCHRCGSSLKASDLFCANCGAPQLKFAEQEETQSTFATAHSPRYPSRPQGISGKNAVIAASLAAIPVAIFSSISYLSWGFCLWVIGGAILAIALYRRRAPDFLLDLRSGVRIGMLAGLIAAYLAVALAAVVRLSERYAFHLGTVIDRDYALLIQQSTMLIQSNPDTQAQLHAYMQFLLSPDGRAAWAVMNAVTTVIGMILFSALGGALGARLLARSKGAFGNS